MQVLLMHSTEDAQVGPEPHTSSFTGVAVPLTSAIGIIIPCPFVHPVTDGRMERMAAPIALPLVGIGPGAAGRHVFGEEAAARPPVGVIAHPKPVLSPVSRDTTLMMGGRSLA
jgi:hypothetical protein